MTIGAFAKRFPSAEHPSSWISANEENVIAYEADPLCTFTFTLNGNRALLRLMRRAYGLSPTRGNPTLPVRFFSGAEDPCATRRASGMRWKRCGRRAFRTYRASCSPACATRF